jgi:hypothetical protein
MHRRYGSVTVFPLTKTPSGFIPPSLRRYLTWTRLGGVPTSDQMSLLRVVVALPAERGAFVCTTGIMEVLRSGLAVQHRGVSVGVPQDLITPQPCRYPSLQLPGVQEEADKHLIVITRRKKGARISHQGSRALVERPPAVGFAYPA